MKYYIIAGEASGDLHGSNLIRSLKHSDPEADIRCWGGDRMQEAGGKVVKHIRELAFMGFAEVVKNLPSIFRNIRFCKEDILAFGPDVLVLIDYPGFNLRIAKWARTQNLKIVYYISPQIWAWKESRIKQIKKNVDKMLVIFPFEKTFYEKWDYEVEYVGHPLVPVIDEYIRTHPVEKKDKTIALLPGSRKQEINAKLPIMLSAAQHFPNYRFVVAAAPAIEPDYYETFLRSYPRVRLSTDTYRLLLESDAALVTSGTATLETALLKVPEVVCYKTSPISYTLGKWLVKLKFICIVNLIMNKEVVKELIQQDLNTRNITDELKKILFDEKRRNQVFADYAELKKLLYLQGNASDNAARAIIQLADKV